MNKVLFVRVSAHFVNPVTEHRKRGQKHSKGRRKVTPDKEIVCLGCCNLYSHLVL